jgi:hypothetical protein
VALLALKRLNLSESRAELNIATTIIKLTVPLAELYEVTLPLPTQSKYNLSTAMINHVLASADFD